MQASNIVVIGGSAGAIGPLQQIVKDLPPKIAAAVLVVLHVAPDYPSVLPEILNRERGPAALSATDGAEIRPSIIYVAPPDHHLIISDGAVRLTRGPLENRHRPAIDPLFRSAARAFGAGVVAVLLSGARDDGIAGLQLVTNSGGTVIVLDPKEARFPEMPINAIRYARPDYVLPAREIGSTITRLIEHPDRRKQVAMKNANRKATEKPSGYVCPDCGGPLFEQNEDDPPRFRCRVGHRYSIQSLLSADGEALEEALWAAVRALEGNADLNRRTGQYMRSSDPSAAKRLLEDAEARMEQANLIRDKILQVYKGDIDAA
ncbi:MAG TPA: chemotaxis protein CheB [Candidatus Angelobacter sp.]|nr:chemotaxis protein CheB [Candidatus Angelobacter sp.]